MVTEQETEWAKSYKAGDEVITFIRNKEGIRGEVMSVQKRRYIMGEKYEIVVHCEDNYQDTIYYQNGNGKEHIKKINTPKGHNFF